VPVGKGVMPNHYSGWQINATAEFSAPAVAAGKPLASIGRPMIWALGHAATQRPGSSRRLRQHVERIGARHAAKNGLAAALFARLASLAPSSRAKDRYGFAPGHQRVEQVHRSPEKRLFFFSFFFFFCESGKS